MKKIVGIIINSLLVFAIFTALVISLSPYRPFIVLSGSMEPYIRTGSLIIGEKVGKSAEISVNEVYSYEDADSGYLITHRLIGMQEDAYIFKGDNNKLPDDIIVKRSQIKYQIIKNSNR